MIQALAARFPTLSQADAAVATALFLSAISTSLAHGGRVEIRGFGSFGTKVRPPRIGRNPNTGEEVEVPAKSAVNFKAGLDLRERVDKRLAGW